MSVGPPWKAPAFRVVSRTGLRPAAAVVKSILPAFTNGGTLSPTCVMEHTPWRKERQHERRHPEKGEAKCPKANAGTARFDSYGRARPSYETRLVLTAPADYRAHRIFFDGLGNVGAHHLGRSAASRRREKQNDNQDRAPIRRVRAAMVLRLWHRA